ncbi:MAG: hypothetical protein LBG28_02420, partial [Tannerella sp.]|nr:hypothetical protein [Tannerella sp.]
MERLIEHIERLLLWHDCVIIPDFGGFVLQPVPAVYTGDEHLFTPARKEVVFNPTLTHNDGLLIEAYMQRFAMSFNEARKYILTDVANMKEDLDNEQQIKFGRIGLFIKEDERTIFIPSKNSDELFCPSSYGLPVFYYLSLVARGVSIHNMDNTTDSTTDSLKEVQLKMSNEANRPGSNHIIYTIPVTRTFVHVFAATVAAIVLFFLISTPVKDVNNASYSAGFVPPEIMPKKSAGEIVFNAFADKDIPDVETNKTVMNTAGEIPMGAVPEVSTGFPAIKEEAEKTAETVTKSGGIVSATSATKPSATSVSSTAASSSSAAAAKSPASQPATTTSPAKSPASQPAATKPSTATKSSSAVAGKFYVIIGSFDTRARAQRHINSLKSDIAD